MGMLSSPTAIPYEILKHVLDYLDQEDVLSLSQTSRQFRSEELLLNSTYEGLIRPSDVPLAAIKRKYKQWRLRVEKILKGVDAQTGPFVKRMAVPDYKTDEKLAKILQYCGNLEFVDFRGVQDRIECCAVRNDLERKYVLGQISKVKLRQASEPSQNLNSSLKYWLLALGAPRQEFRWSTTLATYPELFSNLKSMAVNFDLCFCYEYAAKRSEGHNLGLHQINCLPHLLNAAPRLQSLTLYAKRDFWPQSLPQSFREPFGSYHSQCLTKLTLVDFRMNILYFGPSFWPWDIFNDTQALRLSLHSDICGLARQDRRGTMYLLRYVEALMAACSVHDFKLASLDESESEKFAVALQSYLTYSPTPTSHRGFYQTSGHRFSELSILWSPTSAFPEIDLEPGNVYERATIAQALLQSRQTPQQHDYEVLEKLAREARGASLLFRQIRDWFPKLRRLALYIPSAIYPSTDQEIISTFLPGTETETWEIQHHDPKSGIEQTAEAPWEYHIGRPYEKDLANRIYESSTSPSKILHNAMPYPLIHRTSTKKLRHHESGNSEYLKEQETKRYNTFPPHPPTVADLVHGKEYWTEEPWMVILRQYCRCNGFLPTHIPAGVRKADFSLEAATIEELREVARAVGEDVLYAQ
ncbi:MAG: hypothetical protein Q9221_003214 [Calogaya cf. arnoldii]